MRPGERCNASLPGLPYFWAAFGDRVLSQCDDQGVDDGSDAEGDEVEDEIDPEMGRETDLEPHCQRRDKD